MTRVLRAVLPFVNIAAIFCAGIAAGLGHWLELVGWGLLILLLTVAIGVLEEGSR